MEISEIESDLIRERAEYYFSIADRFSKRCRMHCFGFIWVNTKEGWDFWKDVHVGLSEKQLRKKYPRLNLWKVSTANILVKGSENDKVSQSDDIFDNSGELLTLKKENDLIKENEELKKKLEEIKSVLKEGGAAYIEELETGLLIKEQIANMMFRKLLKTHFHTPSWQEEISKDWTDEQKKEMLEYLNSNQ